MRKKRKIDGRKGSKASRRRRRRKETGRKDRQTSETKKRWKVLMARNGTSNEDPA